MEKLRVRCPSCLKLYSVAESAIRTSDPRFECVACETKFTFHYPPESEEKIIVARVLGADAGHKSLGPWAGRIKTCGKCGTQNSFESEECSQCRVVFEKLRDLPLLGLRRVSPRLIKSWTELIRDFGKAEEHLLFIKACEQENCLEFAELRYKQYLEVQAFDEMAQNHLELVRARRIQLTDLAQANAAPEKTLALMTWWKKMELDKMAESVDWKKTSIRLGPYAFGLLLIILGFIIGGSRNLVGAGVAFLILWVGFSFYFGNRFNGLPRK